MSEPRPRAAPADDPGHHEPAVSAWRVLTSKPVRAVVAVLLLAVGAELVRGFDRFRILTKQTSPPSAPQTVPEAVSTGEAVLRQETGTRSDLAQPEQVGALPRAQGPIAAAVPEQTAAPKDVTDVPIVDPSHSLDRFFAALSRTAAHVEGAISRIVYFGDSVVASDFGTGTLRRLLQTRFGDAGHGFVLVASAWPQYFHNDVYRLADAGFHVSRIVGPRAADGLYGLGGVSFTGPPGLRARIGSAKTGSFGRKVSRFDLSYLEQPGGGVLQIRVDGELVRTLDTDAPAKRAAYTEVRVPDGEHELELRTARGMVRLFGVALERDVPGVVLDAIGVVGARLRTLDESDDGNFAEALAWRHPNLVTYQFGANESGDGFAYPMPEYHRTMRLLIEQVARAVPEAGCLVIGAMDRARKEGDRWVTVPVIPLIVEEQRKVASEAGCAFFDTFRAMGGRGSMVSWVHQGFGAGDYTHPTSWGAERLGKWIYGALLSRYDEYVRESAGRQGRAGSPRTAPASSAPSSP